MNEGLRVLMDSGNVTAIFWDSDTYLAFGPVITGENAVLKASSFLRWFNKSYPRVDIRSIPNARLKLYFEVFESGEETR